MRYSSRVGFTPAMMRWRSRRCFVNIAFTLWRPCAHFLVTTCRTVERQIRRIAGAKG